MDDIVYLINEEATGTDADGNEIIERTERKVFCQVRGISRAEFYDAATDNLKPEIAVTVSNKIDYHGEKLARYHGKLYDIIRTDWRGDAVELMLAYSIGITEGPDGEES